VHEKWGTTAANDITLLKLDRPVDFESQDKHLVPICLPKSRDLNRKNMTCTTAGWGVYGFGKPYPNILQTMDDKIISNARCQLKYGKLFHIFDEMVCSGHDVDDKGFCSGDSGGPMICKIDNVWTQVGIVSWTNLCGEINNPDVYTRVSRYIDWINEKVKNN